MKIMQSIKKYKGLDLIILDDDGRQKKLTYRWTDGTSELLIRDGETMNAERQERLRKTLDMVYHPVQ